MNDRPVAGRAASSAAWLVTARLTAKGIDLLALLVLARVLNPTQFGIVAVAMTLIYIVEAVFELPIHQVLVRLEITKTHLDTAFTLGVLRGLVLMVVMAALAWPFSYIYHDPRLVWLVVLLSLAPVLRSVSSPRFAIFAQQLDYRRDFILELSSKSVALVASVIAALLLRDYRALVIGTLATPATMVTVSYILAPYRPRLSLGAWPDFAQFVGWSTASQLLGAINWQCDRLILGRYVSRARLGEFSMANDLSYLPEQALIKPIIRPLISAFSLINGDPERIRHAYQKTSVTILALGMPIMIGLSLLARPAVELVLSDQWLAAVPILQWLPLTLIPPLFISPLISLAMALGRPEVAMHQTGAETAIKLPLMFAGAYYLGVEGAVLARGLTALLVMMVSLHYVRRLIGTSPLRQLMAAWRVALGGIALALVLIALRPSLAGLAKWLLIFAVPSVAALGMVAYVGTIAVSWHLAGRPAGLEAAAFERSRYYLRLLRNRMSRAAG